MEELIGNNSSLNDLIRSAKTPQEAVSAMEEVIKNTNPHLSKNTINSIVTNLISKISYALVQGSLPAVVTTKADGSLGLEIFSIEENKKIKDTNNDIILIK